MIWSKFREKVIALVICKVIRGKILDIQNLLASSLQK